MLRTVESIRTPAVPTLIRDSDSWITLSAGASKIFYAPSKKQIGALREMFTRSVQAYYRNLFSEIDADRMFIVDVGANIGYSSAAYNFALSAIGRSGQFLLVEPNPINFPFISRNLEGVKNWNLLPVGLSSASGFLSGGIPAHNKYRGHRFSKNTGLLTLRDDVEVTSGTGITLAVIDTESFQKFFPNPSAIGFCKIDIEGGELLVLNSLESWFEAGVVFEIEVNPFYFSSADRQKLENLIDRVGYQALTATPEERSRNANWLLVPQSMAARLAKALEIHPVITSE
jgi:FkbM family methyltransferase